VTEVEAYDERAARELAEFRFREGLAVLQVSDWNGAAMLGSAVIVQEGDGEPAFHADPARPLGTYQMVGKEGQLNSLQKALSDVAEKSAARRTDWERRTLAAARWLAKGMMETLPADAIVSLTTALETLFIRDRDDGPKGRSIAERVSALHVVGPMTRESQTQWLLDIYDRRSDAVHEARDPPTDVDVATLSFLVWLSLVWAVGHLIAPHRGRERPCTTFDEAHGQHGSGST
jgi:hypothetical protein